jgi:hypothetical protein
MAFFPAYSKDSPRYHCTKQKVPGLLLTYKADKYTGDDAFDLLVIYPSGLARETHYDMKVK